MIYAFVGSRDYPALADIDTILDLLDPKTDSIVSGAARGVDSYAAHQARQRDISVQEFPADWVRFGRSAGFKRNHDIVAAADIVVAFHHNASRGTQHSIDLAKQSGKRVVVIVPFEDWAIRLGKEASLLKG